MARKRHRMIGRGHRCYMIDRIERSEFTFQKDGPAGWSADVCAKRVRFRSREERKAWVRGRTIACTFKDGVPLYMRRYPKVRLRSTTEGGQ